MITPALWTYPRVVIQNPPSLLFASLRILTRTQTQAQTLSQTLKMDHQKKLISHSQARFLHSQVYITTLLLQLCAFSTALSIQHWALLTAPEEEEMTFDECLRRWQDWGNRPAVNGPRVPTRESDNNHMAAMDLSTARKPAGYVTMSNAESDSDIPQRKLIKLEHSQTEVTTKKYCYPTH